MGVVTYDPDGWVYAETNGTAGWDLVVAIAPNLGLGENDFVL